jgi:cytochrome c-type biogenesis protein CcmH/NrfG
LNPTEQHYIDLAVAQPRSATPWLELGDYYVANRQLAGAEFAYREALKREPAPETLHNLGVVQIRLGIEALLQAREELPPNDQATTETRRLLQAALEEYQ